MESVQHAKPTRVSFRVMIKSDKASLSKLIITSIYVIVLADLPKRDNSIFQTKDVDILRLI